MREHLLCREQVSARSASARLQRAPRPCTHRAALPLAHPRARPRPPAHSTPVHSRTRNCIPQAFEYAKRNEPNAVSSVLSIASKDTELIRARCDWLCDPHARACTFLGRDANLNPQTRRNLYDAFTHYYAPVPACSPLCARMLTHTSLARLQSGA